MDSQLVEKVQRVSDALHQLNVEFYSIWLQEMLFKWHWWLNFILAVGPWIVWICLRKKESTYRLLFAGIVVGSISMFLDIIGMAMGLWSYNSALEPLATPISPWNFSLIPVFTMLLLQYKPKINPLVKAIPFALLGSLGFQPLFELIGTYEPKEWKHYYSIPIVIVIYLIGHFIATRSQFDKI